VFQGHVILGLETNTSTEDVDQGTSLLSKSIDDRGAGRCQGRLEHITENAENTMELGIVFSSNAISGLSLPLDTSHHLGENNKIDNQRRSKKRVLADIEESSNISIISFNAKGQTHEMVWWPPMKISA
jgi:hypothetical protein